ncbi:MAG: TonB-dependent receptor, partial [Bacteroidales bacterium]
FSLFGIGGLSHIDIWDSDKDTDEWSFDNSGEDLTNGSDVGVIGFSHTHFFKNKTRIKTTLSVLGSRIITRIDTFTITNPDPFLWAGEKSSELKYSVTTRLNKKINAKNTVNLGGMIDMYQISFADSQYYHGTYKVDTDARGTLNLFRGFTQWQHKFTDNFLLYAGFHYQYLQFNKTSSLEPRFGLQWEFSPGQTIKLGYGLHSQIQPRFFYFVISPQQDGTVIQSNRNLEMSKSNQYIIGYDNLFNENLRLKIEGYYQELFNIPVRQGEPAYSLLNTGAEYFIDRQDSLVNEGTGENYGIEITFERFLNNNYYFLITASLFNSTYKGFDGIKRNTAFNGHYVFNAIGGYELLFPNRKDISFNFGLKATWAGGVPYVPYDTEETVRLGEIVMDWEQAYEMRRDDFIRASLRLGIKRNRPR